LGKEAAHLQCTQMPTNEIMHSRSNEF
jgi:hypothetical protein